MKDRLTLEWMEKQLDKVLEMGNTSDAVYDYAMLSTAVREMKCAENRKDGWGYEGKEEKHMDAHHGHGDWDRKEDTPVHLSREDARKWVESMDGGRWTMGETAEYAEKMGMKGEEFVAFYAVMNAMYSDYAEVAKAFGVHRPEFYAAMAEAWIRDEDAVKNKAAAYYKHIVEHED